MFALIARIAAMVLLRSWEFPMVDGRSIAGWETGEIAANLVAGDGFSLTFRDLQPTAWLAPAYPFILSLLFRALGVFSDSALVATILLQALLSSATVVLTYWIGERLGGKRIGLMAGIGLALSPASINVSTRIIWGTTLVVMQICLLLYMMIQRDRPWTWPRVVLVGFLAGLTMLTSPVPLVFFVCLATWTFGRRRSGALRLTAFLLVALATLSPWLLRTHDVLGSWVLVKSNFGNELFIGNNQVADGRYRRSSSIAREVLDVETWRELAVLGEVERSRAFGREARVWIAKNPMEFAALCLVRARIYWLDPFITEWGLLPFGGDGGLFRSLYRTTQLSLLVLAALGIGRALRVRGQWVGLLWYVATVPIPYYLTHANITRYRFLVVPAVFLFAALGLSWLVTRARQPGSATTAKGGPASSPKVGVGPGSGLEEPPGPQAG